MRRLFSILALLILVFATDSFAQFGNSRAIVKTGTINVANGWHGREADFIEGNCGATADNAYVGVIPCTLDGVPNTPFYCLDLCTGISRGDTVKDSAGTIPQAIYITNTYYPSVRNYAGRLADSTLEACAVQFAIWHFRNNLDVSTITQVTNSTATATTVRNRANEIIADVIANGGSVSYSLGQVNIIDTGTDDFYIQTLDTAGAPIAIDSIKVRITGAGSISDTLVSTDISGLSPLITWSGAAANDILTATAKFSARGGITYASLRPLTDPIQLLVLGRSSVVQRSDTITYGALPVELTNFSASVYDRTVELTWQTSEEINNAGFDVERSVSGSQDWNKVGFLQGHGTTNNSYIYSFADRNLASGTYSYRLKQIDYNGEFEYHNLTSEVVIGVPDKFALSQNFPNPFNPETKINFQIPTDGFVSLKVFDNSGKEVATLVNQSMTAGFHTTNFNASTLSSGVYFYRLETQGFVKVMKMALVK